jgi:hypothetical protein
VVEEIAAFCRKRNPGVPQEGIAQIIEATKRSFDRFEYEQQAFLFFLISHMVGTLGIEPGRGGYLLEIARGNVPAPSRLIQFFQLWRDLARHSAIKERGGG